MPSELSYLAIPALTVSSFFVAQHFGWKGILVLWLGYGIGFFQTYIGLSGE